MTTPTQTRHPRRAAVRTALQSYVSLILLVVLALPEIIKAVDAEAGEYLPPNFRALLLGISTASAVLAALGARIMALPGVVRILDTVRGLGWLAAEPPQEAVVRRRLGLDHAAGAHRDDDGDGLADGIPR